MPKSPTQPRPRFVAIRQTKLAIDCRDLIYGGRTRPFGRILRLEWTRLVAHYVKSRALRYSQVLEVADSLGAVLRANGMELRPEVAEFDKFVRGLFSDHLRAAARRNRKPRDPDVYARDLRYYRFRAHLYQRSLEGRCLWCCRELPCERCGSPRVEIDGRGGLREV